MEKRDYCFDYIREGCNNQNCQFSHVIVKNKEEFLRKHAHRIRIRVEPVREYKPQFEEIKTNTNNSTRKQISKCVICQKGFIVSEILVLQGDLASIRCGACLRR
jgi:hypothetical protein